MGLLKPTVNSMWHCWLLGSRSGWMETEPRCGVSSHTKNRLFICFRQGWTCGFKPKFVCLMHSEAKQMGTSKFGAQYATGDSGEITPERMKRQSQSKNSTQLWMWLMREAKSNAVTSNIAQEPGMLGPWIKANWKWSNRRWQEWTSTF